MMKTPLHYQFWPENVPYELTIPETSLFYNLQVSAQRYPNKAILIYYDKVITYAEFLKQTELLAGFLQHELGVKKGDRVLLYMQNSPQFMMAYYAILRADAIVIPVNPMNRREELKHYISDSHARIAITAQDLLDEIEPFLNAEVESKLQHIVRATYSDYIDPLNTLSIPDFVRAPKQMLEVKHVTDWSDALTKNLTPLPLSTGADDLCVMPYTSGTTGNPKGCMHTHKTVMSSLMCKVYWLPSLNGSEAVVLSVLPLFHVTGMMSGMNNPIYSGSTIVLLSRWDKDIAAQCIQKYKITSWTSISTMMIDFLSNPNLNNYTISSLKIANGGGAAMPKAIIERLKTLTGLEYLEGYGMSETMAGVHFNPEHRPKQQCLGVPVFNVDARIINPDTLEELAQGETGEIMVSAPQVMLGYWEKPESNREVFIERDGKRFIRTGDLAYVDEDGYFFMVDRLKRMINASGFKVWPTEVENLMYRHPAIQEACVIASKDSRRGETVKAFVVLNEEAQVTELEIITWCHQNMAVYKAPRIVEFVPTLPKSGTGKVMWRQLQDQQNLIDKEN